MLRRCVSPRLISGDPTPSSADTASTVHKAVRDALETFKSYASDIRSSDLFSSRNPHGVRKTPHREPIDHHDMPR
ncbi:MAG TPA: hypothetical protein VMS40_16455 [Vicinamibacterales bacterium]|nr:hypothetical protein [Vicinamibacterales bacterium]